MPSFVGMANLVDSLYAINQLVFTENKFTLCEFKKILESNYKDNELLRLEIIKSIPKYGNDNDEVDTYFSVISEHLIKECEKYRGMHSNTNVIPSVFCWVMHEYFGRQTIATPDGRKGGSPLGNGSEPCQSKEMNGPTASIISSTKWVHYKFIGGVIANLKFSNFYWG